MIYRLFLVNSPPMLPFHTIGNQLMISSLVLYELLDREKKKYYSWIRWRILMNTSLESGKDYIIFARRPLDIIMSADLTKALLIREGTMVAKKLRRHIEENIEPSLANNPKAYSKRSLSLYPSHELYMLLGRTGL